MNLYLIITIITLLIMTISFLFDPNVVNPFSKRANHKARQQISIFFLVVFLIIAWLVPGWYKLIGLIGASIFAINIFIINYK